MTTSTETQTAAGHGDGHEQVIIDDGLHMHVCSSATFLKIFIALLFLTFVTVAVSWFDFGSLNLFIAMAIASVKAALVMAVFMHLRWDTPINNIAFLGSIIFLSLLFLFTIADFATRGDTDKLLTRPAPVANPFEWK